jgi:DNA-binding transcriptional ArsR family regulator
MQRKIAADELSKLLGVLAHPTRVRIIEELRNGELDVSTLQHRLEERQSKISQHLSVLKTQKLLVERREGRHIFYQLAHASLPGWLVEGLQILKASFDQSHRIKKALVCAEKKWEKHS